MDTVGSVWPANIAEAGSYHLLAAILGVIMAVVAAGMRTSYDAEKAMPLRSARPPRREDRPRRERRAWTPPGGDAGMDAAAQALTPEDSAESTPAHYTEPDDSRESGAQQGTSESRAARRALATDLQQALESKPSGYSGTLTYRSKATYPTAPNPATQNYYGSAGAAVPARQSSAAPGGPGPQPFSDFAPVSWEPPLEAAAPRSRWPAAWEEPELEHHFVHPEGTPESDEPSSEELKPSRRASAVDDWRDRETAYPPESYRPEAYRPETYRPEAYRPEAYRPEAYGPEAYGPEAYGSEAYGAEAYGSEAYGAGAYGSEAYGASAYMPEDHHAEEYSGVYGRGLARVRLMKEAGSASGEKELRSLIHTRKGKGGTWGQQKPLDGLNWMEVNWRSALTESNLETANGILAGIEFGDQVVTFSIQNNPAAALALLDQLPGRAAAVKCLHIYAMELTADHVPAICRFVEAFPDMEEFHASDNFFGDDGVEAILRVFIAKRDRSRPPARCHLYRCGVTDPSGVVKRAGSQLSFEKTSGAAVVLPRFDRQGPPRPKVAPMKGGKNSPPRSSWGYSWNEKWKPRGGGWQQSWW